ncbi:hypothetical protein CCYA_CCYA02G0541 [Cyanidiococcus yangmingshanensis]|uniref:Small ribosomal subunit protein eS19 n=1 Tax=Cyanidiococcus yangmingshanensis TaxID=2690220 RepID=A0A7J7IN74_9RHOD|nr:40S ribosomal protein S19 [Cyanidiococcus yangmingshanensis]KAK4529684.1 hypothetical protein CCYA_CCYA02G0541 [Cyanidiococcus yangmingshanensis]
MAPRSGITLKDVPADQLIRAYAAHLKKQGQIREPDWMEIVKTGSLREMPPQDRDWLYVRMAALARQVYLRQNLGVGAYSRKYGGRKRNGPRPAHFATGSRAIIRYCLQELERLGLVARDDEVGGRVITRKGRQELDTQAARVHAERLAAAT